MALAWDLANSDCTVALCGASKLSQFESNLKALELVKKWNKDLENRIEKVLGNKPETEISMRTF